MASAVATPLERRFGRIAGLPEMTSISSLGTTQLTLQFDLDRDVTAAARDVQAAINAAGGRAAAEPAHAPQLPQGQPGGRAHPDLSLTSETLPLAEVFDAANTVLAQKISQVEGVGQVTVGGGQQPAVRVQVDPASPGRVGARHGGRADRPERATVNAPKGALTGAEQSYALAANDQLFGAGGIRSLVIVLSRRRAVRLRDVARVTDDVENNRVAAWSNGTRAVLLIIRRAARREHPRDHRPA